MSAGTEPGELRFSKEIRATEYKFENYLGDNHLLSVFLKGKYRKRRHYLNLANSRVANPWNIQTFG